jgi:hypothetical protein
VLTDSAHCSLHIAVVEACSHRCTLKGFRVRCLLYVLRQLQLCIQVVEAFTAGSKKENVAAKGVGLGEKVKAPKKAKKTKAKPKGRNVHCCVRLLPALSFRVFLVLRSRAACRCRVGVHTRVIGGAPGAVAPDQRRERPASLLDAYRARVQADCTRCPFPAAAFRRAAGRSRVESSGVEWAWADRSGMGGVGVAFARRRTGSKNSKRYNTQVQHSNAGSVLGWV